LSAAIPSGTATIKTTTGAEDAAFLSAISKCSTTIILTLLLGFRLTGPFVIMLYKMLSQDVARFASIYLLVLFGHGSAWYVLEMPTGQEVFHEYFWRIKRVFLLLFGDISFEEFAYAMEPGYNWLSTFLMLLHIILVFILLLNLLIGMMGDTFHEIKDRADEEWHLAYAQIISSVESEIPPETLQTQVKYWTTIGNKRYLQVQDVNDDYFKAEETKEDEQKEIQETAMKELDADNDGIVTVEEVKQLAQSLEEKGENFGLTLRSTPSQMRDRSSSTGSNRSDKEKRSHNLGPSDKLEGRLDPSLSTGP